MSIRTNDYYIDKHMGLASPRLRETLREMIMDVANDVTNEWFKDDPNTSIMYDESEVYHLINKALVYYKDKTTTSIPLVDWFELNKKK